MPRRAVPQQRYRARPVRHQPASTSTARNRAGLASVVYTGTVTNSGTVETSPTFTIEGPIAAPYLESVTAGKTVWLNVTVGAGETLVVDFATKTVTVDDVVQPHVAAITSRWRSGWFDYSQPEVKTIRESKVWGSGKVYLSIQRDFLVPTGTSSQLDFTDPTASTWNGTTWGGGTWSQSPALIPRLRRYAVRGAVFSTYLANTVADQAWSVARLDHHLREARIPSARTGVPA